MKEDFKFFLEKTQEIGRITSISYSVILASGLPGLKLNEMVICEEGQKGVVFGLDKERAEILMLETKNLQINKGIVRTNQPLQIEISEKMLGRIVDPLCRPIDGKGPIEGEKFSQPLERPAPPLIERERVKKHLETGVFKVDLFVPLGCGQRELIIGNKKTGKTTFLLQTITSQARRGIICIYTAVGKRVLDLKLIERYLKEQKILEKVIIVAGLASQPSPQIFFAPYVGMSIAEFFRERGKDVLIIFDDLTSHAKVYREISLLLERFPGRSSYPGDIFHIHAKLLERAGNVKHKNKEVSITALPVADTIENELGGYIQTNLMAITDGHIFFDLEEFQKGMRPAINVFLSVSRVGNQTKTFLERELAGILRQKMIEYKRALEIAPFGVELPKLTQEILDFGKKLELLLAQEAKIILKKELQLFLLGLMLCDFWKERSLEEMKKDLGKIKKRFEEKELLTQEDLKKIKNLEELKNFIKERALPELQICLH